MLRLWSHFLVFLSLGCASDLTVFDRATYDRKVRDAYRAYEREDYALAFERFSYTARIGDKSSQYTLALLYLRGLGTERDLVTGTAWLDVASEVGKEEWLEASTNLMAALDPEQRTAAFLLAEDLKARYGMAAQGVICGDEVLVGSHVPRTVCRKRPGRYTIEDGSESE